MLSRFGRLSRASLPLARTSSVLPSLTQRLGVSSQSEGTPAHVDVSLRRLESLFGRYGREDYIGEPISVEGHSVQVAECARRAGESNEMVVAGLLHDVGHLLGFEAGFPPGMDGCGIEEHERIGAEFMSSVGFAPLSAYLCANHVAAKRYLARDPEYAAKLTPASKTTLSFQGGVMTDAEAGERDADKNWQLAVRMRQYDEAGKDVKVEGPHQKFGGWVDLVRESLVNNAERGGMSEFAESYVLSSEQKRFWNEMGFLVIRDALPKETVARLGAMAQEAAEMAAQPGPMLIHHELVGEGEERLCRVENYCKTHADWGKIAFGVAQDCVTQAVGEPVVLFKDKLNYKGPQGGGFKCHQDATAYATDALASRHVSVMVAIDEATPENGCLEIAPGRHKEGVIPNTRGVTNADEEAEMEFAQVLVQPGDLVLFDSYLPHRSEGNRTEGWRRLAYLTYNPLSEGDLHEAYYAEKARNMESGTMSLNDDFGGKLTK